MEGNKKSFIIGDNIDYNPTIYDERVHTMNLSAKQSSYFPCKVLKQLVLRYRTILNYLISLYRVKQLM